MSAASDDTRKGETEMDAPPRHSLRVRADSDGSIARQARFVTAAVFVVAPKAQ